MMTEGMLIKDRMELYNTICDRLHIDKSAITLTDSELILDDGILHIWCNPNIEGLSQETLNGSYVAHSHVYINSSITFDKVQHSDFCIDVEKHRLDILALTSMMHRVYGGFNEYIEEEKLWRKEHGE